MEMVKQIDAKLSGVFKDLPPLPKDFKETLVKVWPWLALIFGVLQLAAAWALWRLLSVVDAWNQVADYYARAAGVNGAGISTMDRLAIYVGVAVLLADAVILLLAFNPLNARARRGWDLLFLALLLNVAYGVVALFVDGRGIGGFVLSLLGSAVGFYLLYQVKDMYGKAKQPKDTTK